MAISAKTFLTLHRIYSRIPGVRLIHKFATGRHKVIIPDKEVFGLRFRTPLGLAPGLDCNADYLDFLPNFGFSHICVGPLTPRPQENAPEVNNRGIRYALAHLQPYKDKCGKLAIDLTAGSGCEGEIQIVKDFNTAFSLAYDFADFFILDFSPASLKPYFDEALVTAVCDTVLETRLTYETYRPVIVRLPAGVPAAMVEEIVSWCRLNGVDGISVPERETVRQIAALTGRHFPVIYTGPVGKPAEATAILSDGADLIGISDEFVSRGGKFVANIYKTIEQQSRQ